MSSILLISSILISTVQGTSEAQARSESVAKRSAFRAVSASIEGLFSASNVIQSVRLDDEIYFIRFEDDSQMSVSQATGKVIGVHSSEDARGSFTGQHLSTSQITSIVTQCYQALGYSHTLAADGFEDYFYGPGGPGIRFAHYAPVVNGIPCGREFAVDADLHPVTGAVSSVSCRPLPNFNFAMEPVLTVQQARPILLGYLFTHANISSAIETEYDVRLRWGQAPLGDEVDADTYIPTGDLAALRASNTALLMYDVRFFDPEYPEPKLGGAYYRVIMDARTGQVVGMDGPIIAMFGGGGKAIKPTVGWNWGDGPMSIFVGKRERKVQGNVVSLSNAGKSTPKGSPVILNRGNSYIKASYDQKNNILWKRVRFNAVIAGRPTPALAKAIQELIRKG